MNRVFARRITHLTRTVVSDWLEGWKYIKNIHVDNWDAPIYVDLDFIDAQIGDWVVFWPSGARITYSGKSFDKHFHWVEGVTYETPWTPLFNAQNFSRPVIN